MMANFEVCVRGEPAGSIASSRPFVSLVFTAVRRPESAVGDAP